jgi:hypothetical protein
VHIHLLTIQWLYSLLQNTSALYLLVFIIFHFIKKQIIFLQATAFFDGRIRIYDFQGPNIVNKEEIQTKMSNLSCISWSTARYIIICIMKMIISIYFRHHLAPLIAVGSDDCNTSMGAKLQLWEYAADR